MRTSCSTKFFLDCKKESANSIFHKLGKAPLTPTYQCEGYWVWGSAVVKGDDNEYHMFVTRFPQKYPFHPGWIVSSEIVHAVSDNIGGPYKFSDVSLPARGAQYWDGCSTHNPRILRHKDKYYLIYMGTHHPFETPKPEELTNSSKWCVVSRSNKRIGLAVSDSPYGPWKRFEKPILDTEANTFYSFLTSNPSPTILEDGSVYMIFKGRAYGAPGRHTSMSLGMAYAPSIEGPYKVLNDKKPIFNVKGQGEAEDPFLWKDKKGFHIVFRDQMAKFTGEQGAGVLAHSKDAVHWTVDKEAKAYSKNIEWEDGSTSRQGHLERTFIYVENGKPSYIFFATMDGPGGFNNSTASWNMGIPIGKQK